MRGVGMLTGLAAAVALLAAGCGGDSNSGRSTTPVGSAFQIIDWESNLLHEATGSEGSSSATEVVTASADEMPSCSQEECSYVINNRPAITAANVARATVGTDTVLGEPVVNIDLDSAGQSAFKKLTAAIAHREAGPGAAGGPTAHFAVIVDGSVLMLPTIDFHSSPDGIDASKGIEITGGFTAESARSLADELNSG